MVKWLAPRTLVRAALETGVSFVFGRFADKREIQGALPADAFRHDGDEPGADGTFWIDFASDVGDGFNSTYTIAWLLAQPTLKLTHEGSDYITERGRLLILGGDEVYPAARWDRYRERFVLPYRAALPFVDPAKAPNMFAIPGNHDWYDGLTSFMRLFCQERWIGGWRTAQHRSYFAIKLPHRWWLWGIDIQLDTYLDEPQIDYFESVAGGEQFQRGDRVILITSKPSWVRAEEQPVAQSWSTLKYFEERVVKEYGGVLALTLTGDIHHYCHYEAEESFEPRHRVTCGGGGAFLSATHTMRPTIEVGKANSNPSRSYARVATFPDVRESARLSRGVLRLVNPFLTPTLGMLVGGIYALFALALAAGLKDQATSVLGDFDGRGPVRLLGDALTPTFLALALLLILLLISRADVEAPTSKKKKRKRRLYGSLHSAAHIGPAAAATLLALWILKKISFPDEGFWPGYLAALVLFFFGWLWGKSVLATYYYVSHRINPRQHATDVFAAQGIEDYKSFIRLRMDANGELTVFPIGVTEIVKDWRLKESTTDEQELSEPWYEPASGTAPRPELIERPFSL
jgi:hypothetical protein